MYSRSLECTRTWLSGKKVKKSSPVSPSYDDRRGCMIVVPKPIVEALKSPEKTVFKISGSKINVTAGGGGRIKNG